MDIEFSVYRLSYSTIASHLYCRYGTELYDRTGDLQILDVHRHDNFHSKLHGESSCDDREHGKFAGHLSCNAHTLTLVLSYKLRLMSHYGSLQDNLSTSRPSTTDVHTYVQ